jgi:limonene-1,2-epoxide hydrolase
MPLPSAIRPEYFDAAIEKTSNLAEVSALRELKLLAVALDEAERTTQEQSIANRLAANEAPSRVAGPRSALAAAERAAADIHKLELRKCRRATSASEIMASMLQLLDTDIDFWRPAIQKIDLLANRTLSERLLAQKVELRERINAFIDKWHGAA